MKKREAVPVPRPRRDRPRSPPQREFPSYFADPDEDSSSSPNMKPPSRIALLVCFVLGYLIGARLRLILIALAAVAAWVLSNRTMSLFLWHAWNKMRESRA